MVVWIKVCLNIEPILESVRLRTVIHTYTHPSFFEGPVSYSDDDKGSFIEHISREVADPVSETSIRAFKFEQFLDTHKIALIMNDRVKMLAVIEFQWTSFFTREANDFVINPYLKMCKYKATIPTYIISRMVLVKDILVDWFMEKLVSALLVAVELSKRDDSTVNHLLKVVLHEF